MENKTSTANNFIAAVGVFDFHYALAFADLTTGEMMVETIEKKMSLLENELLSQGAFVRSSSPAVISQISLNSWLRSIT